MSGNAVPDRKRSPLRWLHNRLRPGKQASSPSASLHIRTPSASSNLSPNTQPESVQSCTPPAGQGGAPDQVHPPPPDRSDQDFLDKVFNRLSLEERGIIEENLLSTPQEADLVIGQALEATQDKQRQYRNNRGKIREKADNLVNWLNRFKQVGDIMANADPLHAGLPWAGIRLLLEVRADVYCI